MQKEMERGLECMVCLAISSYSPTTGQKKRRNLVYNLAAETEISSSFAGIHRRRFKLYFQFSRSTSSANVT